MSVDLKITTQTATWEKSGQIGRCQKKILEKVCGSKSCHLDSIRETTGKYLWNWKLQHRANWQRSGQIGRCQQNSWKRSVDLGATIVEELGKIWATRKMLVLSTPPEQALLLHCHHQMAMATGTFIALSPSNSKGKQICQQHSLVFAECSHTAAHTTGHRYIS